MKAVQTFDPADYIGKPLTFSESATPADLIQQHAHASAAMLEAATRFGGELFGAEIAAALSDAVLVEMQKAMPPHLADEVHRQWWAGVVALMCVERGPLH